MKIKPEKTIFTVVGVIICILVILFVSIGAIRYLYDYLTMRLAYDCKSKEELCEILENNIDDFEEAVETLSLDGDKYWIDVETASHKLFPFVEVLFGDNIFIEGNKDILTKQLKKEIKNSKVEHILNDLDFVLVTADADKVCFVNRTAIGGAPQLIYARTEDAFDYVHYWNVEKINDNWYYWCD